VGGLLDGVAMLDEVATQSNQSMEITDMDFFGIQALAKSRVRECFLFNLFECVPALNR